MHADTLASGDRVACCGQRQNGMTSVVDGESAAWTNGCDTARACRPGDRARTSMGATSAVRWPVMAAKTASRTIAIVISVVRNRLLLLTSKAIVGLVPWPNPRRP